MSNLSYRIRTEPYSSDQQIKIKLDQHYDQFNILSLTLKPADTWANRCSNFGVVVGRVSANKGFGIPNAKVSIFIPLTAEDEYKPELVARYPYKTTSDKKNGIRYNLLPSIKQSPTHTPVGDFPTKEQLLRDDLWLEIYQKYYRFTTRTNDAGDFMFYGVPNGTYIIHYDVDISDIGDVSVTPFELIAQGKPRESFDGPYKFKSSKDIDSLAQIVSTDKTITVQPFWGSKELCDVQVTRSDFDLTDKGVELKQYALFMGSSVTDSDNNWVNQTCGIKKGIGEQEQLHSMPGKIEILSVIDSNNDNIPDKVEFVNLSTAKIDQNGVWAFLVELNGQKIIKDEYGNDQIAPDDSQGIVMNGFYRFKFSIGPESTDIKQRAKYIIPNNGNHEYSYLFNRSDVIYSDASGNEHTIPGFNSIGDISSSVDVDRNYHCGPLFREFKRKKVYTIRNYIPRYVKHSIGVDTMETPKHLGFKKIDVLKSKTALPYNRMDWHVGGYYDFNCIINSAIFAIVAGINWIIYAINVIIQLLNDAWYSITHAFCSLLSFILHPCIPLNFGKFKLGPININLNFGKFCLWDLTSKIKIPSWCPGNKGMLPYLNYISYVCCNSCNEGENCNCYVPLYYCYGNGSVCNTISSSAGGAKTLKRCNGGKECEKVCKQQQSGSKNSDQQSDNTQKNCDNNITYGCAQLNTKNIGDTGWNENVYSFCIDSLKQCKLGEYACNNDDIRLEFYNSWITGLLYFPQIRYKEKTNNSGYLKKVKFCDADWSDDISFTFPFKNNKHLSFITERIIFVIDKYVPKIVDAGLVKYWPRQNIPPLGSVGSGNNKHDYVKLPFDDIYYNAREMKTQYGYSTFSDPKDINNSNILLATEIMNLGSYLIYDDPDKSPFFINMVPPTTYKKPETLTDFFCFSCNGIIPNDGSSGARLHEKICEFGAEFNDEGAMVNDIYKNQQITYGLYVDEAYHSGRTHILSSNTVDDLINQKTKLEYGDKVEITTYDKSKSYIYVGNEVEIIPNNEPDQIWLNQYKGLWETSVSNNGDEFVKYRSNPYYMYFGMVPGATAIDVLNNDFIPKDICNG